MQDAWDAPQQPLSVAALIVAGDTIAAAAHVADGGSTAAAVGVGCVAVFEGAADRPA